MKELRGNAIGVLAVPAEACFALLAAVDRYPAWLDVVREVDVLERGPNGRPLRVGAQLHVAQSPVMKDFSLVVAAESEPYGAVRLVRLPKDSGDRDQLTLSWSLRGNGETRLELEFYAAVSFLPRILPLGGVGDLIARHVLEEATTALTGL